MLNWELCSRLSEVNQLKHRAFRSGQMNQDSWNQKMQPYSRIGLVQANPIAWPSVLFPWRTFPCWGAQGCSWHTGLMPRCPACAPKCHMGSCISTHCSNSLALTSMTATRPLSRNFIIQWLQNRNPRDPCSPYHQKWPFPQQTFIYFLAAKILGHNFTGFPIPAGCSILKTKQHSYWRDHI